MTNAKLFELCLGRLRKSHWVDPSRYVKCEGLHASGGIELIIGLSRKLSCDQCNLIYSDCQPFNCICGVDEDNIDSLSIIEREDDGSDALDSWYVTAVFELYRDGTICSSAADGSWRNQLMAGYYKGGLSPEDGILYALAYYDFSDVDEDVA
ncbi:MAG: hypothetical protein LBK50_00445 [Candidatus Nomurabacteria bacterium]|jgi:hypothetical protein|nr:hypothetical protein [Candidatus Nomurabacteria bacterium]